MTPLAAIALNALAGVIFLGRSVSESREGSIVLCSFSVVAGFGFIGLATYLGVN